ncbi:fatty acid desaturase [Caulobacter segnis]|uniref:Fatty acid desaturase n=1 Tax=Caulobacter segnis TaxID=88688 RepID=A0A2W5X3J8_9CAUL|nr:fatty acid desaturase [Caulobacter segnis]PZR35254.1 MAG: fatty acid desaturase [Caulobacter segnis]
MAKTASDSVSLTRQAYALTDDLMTPKAAIYWIDLLVSAGLMWGGFLLAASTSSLALGLVAGLVSVLALYRALSFIHELTHIRDDEAPGFRLGWNVLVGVPLMTPSLMYEGVHNVHHVKDRFGTALDPEYLPLSRYTPLSLAGFLFVALLAPLGVLIRSAILTPLSFLIPPLRRFVQQRLSALVINPDFVREDMTKLRPAWLIQDIACWLWSWTIIAATLLGVLPVRFVLTGLAIFSIATFVNQARTLVAHHWDNDGGKMTLDEQFLDSVNVPPPNLASELWAPVGLRYHALHHLLPRLPYHNLGKAHARLAKALAPDSLYHRASQKGLFEALAALFQRVARKPALASQGPHAAE